MGKYKLFTTLILLIIMAIPQNSFLRNAKTGSLLNDSPIINGVGLIILLIFGAWFGVRHVNEGI